jgi:hypothetical protein
MRTETTTRTLYKFSELSPEAQQHALEQQSQIESEYFDPEFVYDDAATIADLFGLDLDTRYIPLMNGSTRPEPTIYYSGFSSQGDGACFEGTYSYKAGALKAVKYHAGQDERLHRIVKALQDIQRKNFYQLTARCKHSGHYYHSGCMSVDVERQDEKEMTADAEETVKECLRDFADWIYKQLENEYDYRTGEEACREAIEANDYEFTEKGDMV